MRPPGSEYHILGRTVSLYTCMCKFIDRPEVVSGSFLLSYPCSLLSFSLHLSLSLSLYLSLSLLDHTVCDCLKCVLTLASLSQVFFNRLSIA